MCRIRRARKDEAEIATQIAKLAKASWGYPDKWLEEWDPELTISGEYMEANEVFVVEGAGVIVGIAALGRTSGEPTLEHLWILPDHQRKGIGRQLFEHAAKEAKNMGWEGFQVISDPYARNSTRDSAPRRSTKSRSRWRARTEAFRCSNSNSEELSKTRGSRRQSVVFCWLRGKTRWTPS